MFLQVNLLFKCFRIHFTKRKPYGSKSIDSIKLSDAKEWTVRMKENGYAYGDFIIVDVTVQIPVCQAASLI